MPSEQTKPFGGNTVFGLSKKTILLLIVALIVGARYRAQIATLPVVGSLV